MKIREILLRLIERQRGVAEIELREAAREALAALDDKEAMKAAFQEAADQASAENRLSYRKDPAVWINGFAAAWQAAHRRLGVKDA